jgi:hypothetical protein
MSNVGFGIWFTMRAWIGIITPPWKEVPAGKYLIGT